MNKDKMIESKDLFIAPVQQEKEEEPLSVIQVIRQQIKN